MRRRKKYIQLSRNLSLSRKSQMLAENLIKTEQNQFLVRHFTAPLAILWTLKSLGPI